MGRPLNDEPTVRKVIALPAELWDQVSEYRFTERIATEAEAIRELIRAGLKAMARRK